MEGEIQVVPLLPDQLRYVKEIPVKAPSMEHIDVLENYLYACIYSHNNTDRMWHKVNFQAEFKRFESSFPSLGLFV